MKAKIICNLLLISSITAYSQNLLTNESNISLGNFGGNYYSNVLGNGGGNSVIVNNPINFDNNINIQVQRNYSNPVNKVQNVSVNAVKSRQNNTPVQTTVTRNVQLIHVASVNTPPVTKVPGSGSMGTNNVIKTKDKTSHSKTRTHKKRSGNFYTQTKTKVKHKRKPRVKKLKFHTSRCPVW